VLPAVRLEKETIGDGKVGPTTQRLREALLARIQHDCAGDPTSDEKPD
jgi:hypothetical protein